MLKEHGGVNNTNPQVRERSPYADALRPDSKKNQERFDQSPQPNYPNFEPKKQASQVQNMLSKPKIGDIGWGIGSLQAPKGKFTNYSNIM